MRIWFAPAFPLTFAMKSKYNSNALETEIVARILISFMYLRMWDQIVIKGKLRNFLVINKTK